MTTLLEQYLSGLDQVATALASATRPPRRHARRSRATTPPRRARPRVVRRVRRRRSAPLVTPRYSGRGTCPRCNEPNSGLITSGEGLLCRNCHPDLPEAS